MAWLAVDNKTYTECVFECKPERASNFWYDAAGGSRTPQRFYKKVNRSLPHMGGRPSRIEVI